ncbi:MAG: hypothetical protein ABII90_14110 [Bacteroidota bacterium]
MRVLLLMTVTIIWVCFSETSFSQDAIYKTDGSRIEAKVIEITGTEIKYKKFSNPDGPLYTINYSEVVMIIYKNGDSEVYSTHSENVDKCISASDYKNNIISISFFDIILNRVMVCYEFISESGTTGIKIPFAIGHWKDNFSFISGLDMNFYPKGQGRVRYFFGPNIRAGYMNNRFIEDEPFISLMMNNGVSIQPMRNINVSFSGALGVKRMVDDFDDIEPWGSIAFTLGYRF